MNQSQRIEPNIKKEFVHHEHGLTETEKNMYAEKDQLLIHKVANNFSNSRLEYNDLFGIAQVGFVIALNKYKKNQGVKFTTYAYKIMSNEILQALRKEKKKRVYLLTEKAAEWAEVANSGIDDTVNNLIPTGDKNPAIVIEIKELLELLLSQINVLSELEQIVIEYRYGLNNKKKLSQKNIAKMINSDQSSVSKMEHFALKKLRIILKSKGFDLKNK